MGDTEVNKPIILFRYERHSDEEEEARIAAKYFNVVPIRSQCDSCLVIGRYSVLPYYNELCEDLRTRNCWLINDSFQHHLISTFKYYEYVKGLTFETWDDSNIRYCQYDGPFVVRGKTNSRKHQWNTKMFAPTKRDALVLASDLMADPLIGPQGVIYRRYEPLESLGEGLNGLNFANEWRFFVFQDKILSFGYYWTNAEDYTKYAIEDRGLVFAEKVVAILRDYLTFYVIDIAKTQAGEWRLVEVNDAQMSGLSACDPDMLYGNLKRAL